MTHHTSVEMALYERRVTPADVFETALRATKAAKKAAGGDRALAEKIGGLTRQAVSQWRRVPAERVLDVERASGVPRHELRPDLYPAPQSEAAQ
jgi:DNA-binding transcriptional regulator YdaS (Cro superfamily)